MKSRRFVQVVAAVSACTLALAVSVGCGSPKADDAVETTPASDTQQTNTQDTTEQQSDPAPADSSTVAADTAVSLGYQVFEGTVHIGSAEDILALQESDLDPAVVGYSGTYAVLVFDQETEVSGMSADGSGERTNAAKVLGVAEYTEYDSFVVEYGDLESWRPYDGQHVKVAAKAEEITFPSDVRLPLGEPTASNATILE